MKASTSRSSPVAGRALKLFGIIFVVSFLVDFVILLLPFEALGPEGRAWQINFTTQLVDRGIVPMVGIAFVLVGFWIDGVSGVAKSGKTGLQDLRFWMILVAAVLGVGYLVLFPIHLNNVFQERAAALTQIDQQATQLEGRLNQQLDNPQAQTAIQQRQQQIKGQVSQLLQNEQQLGQVLGSENVGNDMKTLLEQAQQDPNSIDQLIQDQFSPDALRKRGQTQIRQQKEDLQKRAQNNALKSGVRTGLSSLLLAIGYLGIGGTGLLAMKNAGQKR